MYFVRWIISSQLEINGVVITQYLMYASLYIYIYICCQLVTIKWMLNLIFLLPTISCITWIFYEYFYFKWTCQF